MARVHRLIDPSPPGRWWRARLHAAIEYSHTEIHLERGHDDLDGLCIAFLSDLHAGHYLGRSEIERIAERIAESQPDLVLLGGDLINVRLRELRLCAPLWESLSPPLGVFAVPGNHDYFRPDLVDRWPTWLERNGVPVLTNRGVRVQRGDASLWLCGVDDLTEGAPCINRALEGRRDEEPTLLLSHHPDLFRVASERGVDLQLSGHTHGGQVRLFGWAPLNHSRYGWLRGHHRRHDAQLYVGRGVGCTLVPVRIGAPPEVPILRLRRDAAAGAANATEPSPAPSDTPRSS
ncbi:MAG: metallophosphoesterase [Planctomycetota bacterium]